MDSPKVEAPLDRPSVAENDYAQLALDARGLEFTSDGLFVRWSPGNKKHPRNWALSRKIYDCGLITFLDLFTYVKNFTCGPLILGQF